MPFLGSFVAAVGVGGCKVLRLELRRCGGPLRVFVPTKSDEGSSGRD